jgi:predicted heme/steroid binding protein
MLPLRERIFESKNSFFFVVLKKKKSQPAYPQNEHNFIGLVTATLLLLNLVLGFGAKGSFPGVHYDRLKGIKWVHRILGYGAVLLGMVNGYYGMLLLDDREMGWAWAYGTFCYPFSLFFFLLGDFSPRPDFFLFFFILKVAYILFVVIGTFLLVIFRVPKHLVDMYYTTRRRLYPTSSIGRKIIKDNLHYDYDGMMLTWEEFQLRVTSRGALWIVLDGQIIDVAGFAQMHPGGMTQVLSAVGTDASDVFRTLHPHSRFAGAFWVFSFFFSFLLFFSSPSCVLCVEEERD